MEHNFNEKGKEKGLPVTKTKKYEASKKKAIETIENGDWGLTDSDFWILMNKCDGGSKMAYTGLILSHNGCLKINNNLPDELKFDQSYCSNPIQTNAGMHMIYRDERDGMLEIGEISRENCTSAYPYAMLLKRTFDRVILKKCKLAFDGIYSESESEDFEEPLEEPKTEEPKDKKKTQDKKQLSNPIIELQWNELKELFGTIKMNNYLKLKGYAKGCQISYDEYLELKNKGLPDEIFNSKRQ